ncbi:MAG: hypothetical protein AAB791_01180 [Patescibacteria group bacterium]
MNNSKNKPAGKNFLIFVNSVFLSLMALIALIIIIAGYFLLIKDSYSQLVVSRKDQLAQLTQMKDSLQTQKSQLQNPANATLTFAPSEERLVNLALPDEFDLSSALIQLEGLAKNSGFAISAISSEEAKPVPAVENGTKPVKTNLNNNEVKKIDLRLELVGDGYDSFRKLISDLESSIMFFDVEAVEMGKDSSSYRLSLSTYSYLKK